MRKQEKAMNKVNVVLCAIAGGMLVVAGCNVMDAALNVAGPNGDLNIRYMDGTPDVVAVKLQDTMSKRGFEATVVKTADTTVVQSKTKSGLTFAFLLKSQKRSGGVEQTQVAFEWISGSDPATTLLLFGDLERQYGAKK
jgi:hypothetical protein